MLIRSKRGWELPERDASPESVFKDRRRLVKALGVGPLIFGVAPALLRTAHAIEVDPSARLYPVKRNANYKLDRELTNERIVTTYNNFYEFTTQKELVRHPFYMNKFITDPWPVEISGLCEKPFKADAQQLIADLGVEERVYRFRCVEAWFGRFIWNGWPLHRLLKLAEPTSAAKFVRFVTYHGKDMPNWRRFGPYEEGLRIDEALHDLTLLTVGAYGHPLQKQNGGPMRIVVPWKYGLKSGKSLVRIELTREQPSTTWEAQAPREYPFYSNVDPLVDHPRWSQAKHRVLGGRFWEKEPTQPFNGYAEEVASLYAGMDLAKNY